MTKIRALIAADISSSGLADDEVRVVMSTAALARDGHILVPSGARLDNFRANPIVLWAHSANIPLGNVEDIAVEGDRIRARVRFAPLGISEEADKYRGLVKAGVVRAVSVGFDPIEGKPIDPRKPKGGQRFTQWELWELSFCSVPVDPGALVTARAEGVGGVDNEMERLRDADHRRREASALALVHCVGDPALHGATTPTDYSFAARQRDLQALTKR